jgi:hypothetical protein
MSFGKSALSNTSFKFAILLELAFWLTPLKPNLHYLQRYVF